jgi:hypothetical protein
MAVALVVEFPIETRSTENHDAINARLGRDANPPDGLIVHTAGFDDDAGVFRIFEVWDNQDQAQRYVDERVMPLVAQIARGDGAPPTRQGFYELHRVVTG